MKVEHCDPDTYVAATHYTNDACTTVGRPAGHYLKPTDGCEPFDYTTNVYTQISNVSLEGNKNGLGYWDGISLFFCQTFLFGLCSG